MASEVEDHRVSDAYVRELGRRQQLQIGDPDWLDQFDTTDTQAAIARLSQILLERYQLEHEIAEIRQEIDKRRFFSRILTLSDAQQLQLQALDILKHLGAGEDENQIQGQAKIAGWHSILYQRGCLSITITSLPA